MASCAIASKAQLKSYRPIIIEGVRGRLTEDCGICRSQPGMRNLDPSFPKATSLPFVCFFWCL